MPLRIGDLRKRKIWLPKMVSRGTGAQNITTPQERSRIECTHVTRLVTTILGARNLTKPNQKEKVLTQARIPSQLPLLQLIQRNWHWANNFAQHCTLRLAYLLKQPIASGPTLARNWETTRSKPRVDCHLNHCIWNFHCDTSGSIDLISSLPNFYITPIHYQNYIEAWTYLYQLPRLGIHGDHAMDSIHDIINLQTSAYNSQWADLWYYNSSYLYLEALMAPRR